jgi:hypothetical protein
MPSQRLGQNFQLATLGSQAKAKLMPTVAINVDTATAAVTVSSSF